ncbi:MAG: ABC transporter ATP-binding protein [Clostridia bacterium]|nr:ABC transporter ATP-binding protein [Clostridia bacterium]
MIEFANVSLVRGRTEILKNVSFKAEKGKITSIIGKNGAGKTSALKCLIGECPYTGHILLEGRNIKEIAACERAKRVSYLPQKLPDVPFTVYELARLGRRPYQNRLQRETEEDRKRIKYALELTEMTGYSERRVDTLSGGERQRAYLAMVLSQNTDVIALDEPSAYMDAAVEKDLCALLKMLSRETGRTIIQIMHNLTRAVSDSDSVVILDGGRLIAQSDAGEIRKNSVIEELFLVRKGIFVTENGEKQTVYI